MKAKVFLMIFFSIVSVAIYGQQELRIEYVDGDGNVRQVVASANNRIVIFRPAESAELDIDIESGIRTDLDIDVEPEISAELDVVYNNGLLKQVAVRRADGSVEADLLYTDDRSIQSITTRRDDDSPQAHIVYRDNRLSDIASFRANGDLETAIGYTDGLVRHLSVADPNQVQTKSEDGQNINFFPLAQLLVNEQEIMCVENN